MSLVAADMRRIFQLLLRNGATEQQCNGEKQFGPYNQIKSRQNEGGVLCTRQEF